MTQFSGSKRRLTESWDTFQYVPILQYLAQLLQDQSVIEETDHCSERVRTDGTMEDFCDGTVFSEHPLFLYKWLHIMMRLSYVTLSDLT